jgi:hypothetical protein
MFYFYAFSLFLFFSFFAAENEGAMEGPNWDAAGGAAGPGGAGQPKAPAKQVRRIGAKPPPDRAPRSIYCFNLKNPLRKLCLQVGADHL